MNPVCVGGVGQHEEEQIKAIVAALKEKYQDEMSELKKKALGVAGVRKAVQDFQASCKEFDDRIDGREAAGPIWMETTGNAMNYLRRDNRREDSRERLILDQYARHLFALVKEQGVSWQSLLG